MLITISRQYGAGGEGVARQVAEALGWQTIDDQFVQQVALRAGVQPEDVARLEERAPTFMERLARYTALELPELFVPTAGAVEEFEETKLVKITRNLVTEFAAEGRMVLVGRAVAAVLEHERQVLHVRIIAPRAFRIRVAAERFDLDPDTAAQRLEETDKNRGGYHREFYDRDWNDPVHYHMVLNTERLGFDGASDVIVAHARALGW